MGYHNDHYSRLGLLPSADASVVEAAYTILSEKLRAEGVPETDRRLQELKIAYETIVLGTKASRVGADWLYAMEFYPDLRRIHEYLESISGQLAAEYRAGLLASRDLGSRHEFAKRIEEEYFQRQFGRSVALISFARQVIAAGKLEAATELSRACTLLGDGDPDAIIGRIRGKYFLFQFANDELCSVEAETILRRAVENGYQIVVNRNNSITLNRSSSQSHFYSNADVIRLKDILLRQR